MQIIRAAMIARPVMRAVVAHCIRLQHTCHPHCHCPLQGNPSTRWPERDILMTKRILIDARQIEETRVVVLNGTRIDDFDYETEHRKQLKGKGY